MAERTFQDERARQIGGAFEKNQIERLKPTIYEIDNIISEILGMPDIMVKIIQAQWTCSSRGG